MDPKLEVLKKLFEAQRIEKENKKKEDELYSLSKEICEIKRKIKQCHNESTKLNNENFSLQKENANLRIEKEIIDNEVDLIKKNITRLTDELNCIEDDMYRGKEKFWSEIDDFVEEIKQSSIDDRNMDLLLEERRSFEEYKKEKMLRLNKLQGKFRGLQMFQKLQKKRLKQVETISNINV